jgi:hypothetical protein
VWQSCGLKGDLSREWFEWYFVDCEVFICCRGEMVYVMMVRDILTVGGVV